MVPQEEATANSVPAAAVIQRWRALFGFTGRKACVGGIVCRMWNPMAQLWNCIRNCGARVQEGRAEFLV